MACPGWHASPDYSALWSSARCSSTPLQACLEHPPAATVFYLCSVHDPVPVHDSLSICIEIKAHSALLTCLIMYTESQQEVTKMNSFPLYGMYSLHSEMLKLVFLITTKSCPKIFLHYYSPFTSSMI